MELTSEVQSQLSETERALRDAALRSLREYRRKRFETRQLPHQPKAA